MNGKITMDGFYKGQEEGYQLITHGGKPDTESICSLTMSIHHNIEVSELLKMMRDRVEIYIEADCHSCTINSINRALQEAGKEPLDSEIIEVILEEIEFQRASEVGETDE